MSKPYQTSTKHCEILWGGSQDCKDHHQKSPQMEQVTKTGVAGSTGQKIVLR
jgi:hypothetical protein